MNFPKLRLMVGGGFIVLTAVWLLGASMSSYFHTRSFIKSSTKADGRIMRLVDGTSPSIHYAIYWFRDANDKGHRVYTDIGKHPTSGQPGDKMPLLYQPGHEQDAVRYKFWDFWTRPLVLCGLGVADMLFGIGVLFVAKSQ